MEIDYVLNFWDNLFAIISIIIGSVVAFYIYKLSKQLSAKDKYEHEINISNKLNEILGKKASLADIKKYNSNNNDVYNKSYYKQSCSIHHIIQNYGVVVCLRGSDKFELGLIPFDWIEYIRLNDSEDNCYIIVCKFKGIKWYKNFKSPIKEILKSGI